MAAEEVPLRPFEDDEKRCRAASGDDSRLEAAASGVRPSLSCTSLNEGHHKARPGTSVKARPQFLRTATRLSIRRGRSNSRACYAYNLAIEPEIQAVVASPGQDAIEEIAEATENVGDLEQVTQGQEKTESFFTKYKLERGSLTAFKREARNIIERDLPLILHRDNIIKVWTDKVCIEA